MMTQWTNDSVSTAAVSNATTATLNSSVAQGNRTMPPGPGTRSLEELVIIYSIVIIGPIGIFCNMLSLIVIATSRLKMTSSGLYLMVLSVVDSIALAMELLTQLDTPFAHGLTNYVLVTDRHDALCKGVHFVKYCARFLSALIVVVITAERLYLVKKPLSAAAVLTRKRAWITLIICTIFCLAMSTFAPIFLGVDYHGESFQYCSIYSRYRVEYTMTLVSLNNFFIEGVCSFIVGITTFLIVLSVRAASKKRQNMSKTSTSSSSQTESQMTFVLIAVAVCFIILKIPYSLMWTTKFILEQRKMRGPLLMHVRRARDISQIFYFINHAINFFILVLTGRVIRQRLLELLFCRKTPVKDRGETVISRIPAPPKINLQTNGHNSAKSDINLAGNHI